MARNFGGFISADWRFYVFCGNSFLRLGQIGFPNWELTIREELSSHQYNLIRNDKKLKFYSIFKNDCHKSDCLNIITNVTHKKTLNKFRLGNHRLQIEMGRHTVSLSIQL